MKGYYNSPWPCEDGGPQRLQAVSGLDGLAIQPGENLVVKASRKLATGNMVVLRNPGEVYLMTVDTYRSKLRSTLLCPCRKAPPGNAGNS